MTYRLRAERSTETPMDFEFTNRPSSKTKPVWAAPGEDPHTPKKHVNPPTPSFPTPTTPSWPRFGQNNNHPFLFQEPAPQSPHSPAWVPPISSTFTPAKATMQMPQPEPHDVTMLEASPGGPSPEKDKEKEEDGERTLAVGALRRVFKKRSERGRSQLGRRRTRVDDDESTSGETDEEEDRPLTQKTTNHYTLNVAGPAVPQSDLPYRLLGYVQVFFNGSLAAIALYVLTQFLFMIQRDVEHRVSEYSMEIVQDIAQCNLAYKTNLCAEGRIPAMQAQCAAWETCMNRDPTKVGRAKITFEVFGEVINTFVEQISWKTLIFTVVSLAFFAFFINSVIMLFRSRVNPVPPIAPSHMPHYIPPAIPYHAPHGYLPPAQEWHDKPWKRADEVEEIPTRRRRLEGGQAAKVK